MRPSPMAATGVIPYVIAQVKTADGKVIYRRPNGGGLGRVMDPHDGRA